MSPEQIRQTLGLKRHPTCGFVTETYRSRLEVPHGALPDMYEAARPVGSALYFMVTPDAQIVLHRIRSDQLYHHYAGDPLEVLLLYPDGHGEVRLCGHEVTRGMSPQLFIPGNTFHMSRLIPHHGFALLGSTEWPGVEPPDVEVGDVEKLVKAYPAMESELRSFAQAHEAGVSAQF